MEIPTAGLFVDGKQVPAASGATTTLTNPATGEPLARVADAGDYDIGRAIGAAARAHADGRWRGLPASGRATILLKLAALLRARTDELALLEVRNVGKPIGDARWEVGAAARCFEYYAGLIPAFGGQTLPTTASGTGLTFREPIGVCGLVIPWNFPLLIAAWKLAPCLAAGNTAVLKPAPATPLTALRLAELAREAGVPDGVLNVTPGGDAAGASLVHHPGVRKVAFTGSTEVGQSILRAGADSLKRVSLELGGKSPTVVFADADLEKAAASVLSVFGNAGQDCCARSRILVERRVYDEFVERFAANARAVKLGDPLDEATEVGSLISRSHRSRVDRFVQNAAAAGARLCAGGKEPQGDPFRAGAFYEPTVLAGVSPDSELFRDEVFGPVAALTPFEDETDAITLANHSRYGLSGSIWTRDIGRALRVARAIETGVISINSSSSVHQELPFGGVKSSGIGRDLGPAALEQYTEWKSVFIAAE